MADTTPGQPDDGGQGGSGTAPSPPGRHRRDLVEARRVRHYRSSRWGHVGDAIIAVFARVGLVPSTYPLTTRGRKTGRPLTHPVTVVEHDGRRWMVAPYGPVSSVLNARAARRVSMGRRGHRRDYAVREDAAAEAGPVLKPSRGGRIIDRVHPVGFDGDVDTDVALNGLRRVGRPADLSARRGRRRRHAPL